MNQVLLRFNAPTQQWALLFGNQEILYARNAIINCPCETATRMEGINTKFYILIRYESYQWSTDMQDITFK